MNFTARWSDMEDTQGVREDLPVETVPDRRSQSQADNRCIGEVMQTAVTSIEARASVMAAVDRMYLSGADCLMVMEDERCVGLLTDRDLIVGCVCRHRRPTRTHVRDIMSAVSAYCLTSNTIGDVLAMMTRLGASWLPVNDENGNPIGLVGRRYLDSRPVPTH